MLTIENNGQEILSTNYWSSEHAARGYLYLSINAGAFRLMVPPAREADIIEMMSGHEAIISMGPWTDHGGREAVEIMFEDLSDNPYAVHIVSQQCDRLPTNADRNRTFVLTIWTVVGKQAEMPARLRIVKRIPWMRPWRESN